ncbi:hypothetical protein PITC_011510 [Penicillium italicum]|uniref:Uncharacterized protein n=1 Tax=Penicillium italicum TaxID=40296 RepID=A0A0A2L7N7_PENIT|nr:hypothetical protein PITC_011510 [Penicillium italicum]
MSPKPTPEETSDHLEQRITLIKLDTAIEVLDVHTLDACKLEELNIKRQPMSLNKDSHLKPQFFAPRLNLPPPSDNLIHETVAFLNNKDAFTDPMSRAYHFENDWNSYALSDTGFAYENRLWRSMSVCDYNPFKGLYKYDKPDFGVFMIMDLPGKDFPHMKAVIYHGLEGDDSTLCRGELLIILRLMLGQLRKVRLLHHKVAPILIVSFMGKNARLLESYFEGQSLVVRSSELYELSDKTTTSMVFKGFAEWYIGDPAGVTL